MDLNVSEWVNLLIRWTHVFAAIMWVGTTYYFTWLDGQLQRAARNPESRVWMVHSGGFYTVEKQQSLGVPPGDIHWFRWEAMTTWLTGLALLIVVVYAGGLTVDPISAPVSQPVAIGVAFASLFVGWAIYDALARTSLAQREEVFAAVAFAGTVLFMIGLSRILSARATYIHVGALFGTIMALNVWDRILPSQKKMIAAVARNEPYDKALAASAKHRSKHNTFLAVPTTFIMISNHFPTATYGHQYGLVILAVLILAGWGAAGLLRRA